MDLTRFRRLAREVDEQQRAAMRAIDDAAPTRGGSPGHDPGDGLGHADVLDSRRSFLRGLGLGGTALTVGSAAVALSAASASAQTTTTTDDGAATTAAATTTTTSPPRQPTQADVAILVFAQTLELGLVELYATALDSGRISEELVPVVRTFRDHHRQHGQAYAGLAGKAALNRANQGFVDEFAPRLADAADEAAVLTVLFELENAAASSYVAVLEDIRGVNPATTVANIMPIEARHAVVLGEAAGLRLPQYVPALEEPGEGVGPDQFPVVQR